MTRRDFSGGSAPGDPGVKAPGAGAGSGGAENKALRFWAIEVENSYAVLRYFFPKEDYVEAVECSKYITPKEEEKMKEWQYIKECARRIAEDRGAKTVLFLEEPDWDFCLFILDPDKETVEKLEQFENNVDIIRELDPELEDALENILYGGPYDNEFVEAVIKRDIRALENYARRLRGE